METLITFYSSRKQIVLFKGGVSVITHFQFNSKQHIGLPVGIAIILALFPLIFSAPVDAGMISGDANAISSTWTGTLHAAGVVTLGKQLVADIDYAVYAPGKFQSFVPRFGSQRQYSICLCLPGF